MSTKPWILGAALWIATIPLSSARTVFNVMLDTRVLSGAGAWLAVDFTDGDGATNNTATLTGFATDGAYNPASASTLGDVTGDPSTSLTLGDAQAFSEWLQPLTLGDALSFTLDVGNQFGGSGYPDQFTLFLLAPGTGLPLYATDDPAGLDAVLTLALTGGPLSPAPHAALLGGGAVARVVGVPEPPAWALWPMAALGGWLFRRPRPRRA